MLRAIAGRTPVDVPEISCLYLLQVFSLFLLILSLSFCLLLAIPSLASGHFFVLGRRGRKTQLDRSLLHRYEARNPLSLPFGHRVESEFRVEFSYVPVGTLRPVSRSTISQTSPGGAVVGVKCSAGVHRSTTKQITISRATGSTQCCSPSPL